MYMGLLHCTEKYSLRAHLFHSKKIHSVCYTVQDKLKVALKYDPWGWKDLSG